MCLQFLLTENEQECERAALSKSERECECEIGDLLTTHKRQHERGAFSYGSIVQKQIVDDAIKQKRANTAGMKFA